MRSIGMSGFLKRALPFFATFAVALFITSFFVDLRGPRFGMRGREWERYKMMQRVREENEQLRRENEELRQQLESREGAPRHFHHPGDRLELKEFEVPPPPTLPPAPRENR